MPDTYIDSIDTVALLVKVGDGAGTETFATRCLINSQRGFSATANATASEIANCTNPGAPMKTVRKVTSTDTSISGDGTLPASDAKYWMDWLLSGLPKNIVVNVGSATGALVCSGPYVLTSFQLTGSGQGSTVTASIKLDQADAVTSTAKP